MVTYVVTSASSANSTFVPSPHIHSLELYFDTNVPFEHQSSHQKCFLTPQKDVCARFHLSLSSAAETLIHAFITHIQTWLLQQHPQWFFIQNPSQPPLYSKLLSNQQPLVVAATALWNSLPKHIWDWPMIKSCLFRTAFNHWCVFILLITMTNDEEISFIFVSEKLFCKLKYFFSFTAIRYKMKTPDEWIDFLTLLYQKEKTYKIM